MSTGGGMEEETIMDIESSSFPLSSSSTTRSHLSGRSTAD